MPCALNPQTKIKKMWLQILDFLQNAGRFALDMQKTAADGSRLKDKQIFSIVTKADLGVSEMFKDFVQTHFSNEDYLIIDEESVSFEGADIFERINQKTYQFVIDPIDGTLVYANGMPSWGILIGVFKNLKPVAGFIYLPTTKELAYCVNNKAYYVQNAFEKTETKQALPFKKEPAPSIYLLHHNQYDVDYTGKVGQLITLDFYSQAANALYTLIRDVRANICRCRLWDIAAVMAFVEPLGFVLKDRQTRQNIESINSSWLNNKLALTKDIVLSKEQDFDAFIQAVSPKKNAI